MNKTVVLFTLLTLLSFGCKKQILDENPDYEGVWKSECFGMGCDRYTLTIKSDNTGEYIASGQEIENVHYKGTVRIKDNTLKIGLNHAFTVNTPPTEKHDTVTSYCQCLYGEEMVYSRYLTIDNITFYKEQR
ncbi:MAG TPA: hypothetical protein P5228_07635 [Bacteroidales bacterium]|nr:hypothetical protein [Bacteroidales bacterium]HRZ49014.1 hypothetical protein [Bacteroidales bacterium]